MKQIKNPYMRTFAEYALITASMMLMAAGTYFFKFPNNFSFGGVAGLFYCSQRPDQLVSQ